MISNLVKVGEVLLGKVNVITIKDNILQVLCVVLPSAHTCLANSLSTGYFWTYTNPVYVCGVCVYVCVRA